MSPPLRATEARVREHARANCSPLYDIGRLGTSVAVALGLMGCKDLTGTQALPAGIANPSSYNTAAGALGQRTAVLNTMITEWPQFVVNTGALTDEFQTNQPTDGISTQSDPDQRVLAEGTATLTLAHPTDADYVALHHVRGLARQAIGQLATYDSAASPALRGEMYALAGYAEVGLADLFCSGVPLGTLDFQNDFTHAPSSTTAGVYQASVTQFDSALTLSTDSSRILNLARVGKGRALLDLGQYAQAAQAVANVPTEFQYQVAGRWVDSGQVASDVLGYLHESDSEGGTGLPYISSGDPRSAAQSYYAAQGGDRLSPAKIVGLLNGAGFAPMTVADGIEARLIEAEAALQGGNATTWLAILNQLRATANVPGYGNPQPALLMPLAMPSSDTARVSVMFQERAEWLFATGHRQGDLRRLIRQYHRTAEQVYPIGTYPGGGSYGGAVNAPIPSAEYANPLYHGCLDRDA